MRLGERRIYVALGPGEYDKAAAWIFTDLAVNPDKIACRPSSRTSSSPSSNTRQRQALSRKETGFDEIQFRVAFLVAEMGLRQFGKRWGLAITSASFPQKQKHWRIGAQPVLALLMRANVSTSKQRGFAAARRSRHCQHGCHSS